MSDSALNAALALLTRRDHFCGELELRLRDKGFDDVQIADALRRCSELGYLDDDRVGARWLELRMVARGWGPRRCVWELRRRGVSRTAAEKMVEGRAALVVAALSSALDRLERRERGQWWTLHARRARMVSSLVDRGFELDDAIRAVDALVAERKRDHDATDEQQGDPFGVP